MRWIRTVRLRIRSLFRGDQVERELHDEIQYHIDRLVDEYVASGMSPQEARYAASREMGAVDQRKEECRETRGLALLDGVQRDVGYALRTLRKSPGFTAVALLSLSLGIGANTAIFTLWNGVLHASLPAVRSPEQLVILTSPDDSGMWRGRWSGRSDGPRAWLTYDEFEDLRDHADSFSTVMASQSSLSTWQARHPGGVVDEVSGRLVSGAYFEALGADAAIGALFTTVDDRVEAPHVVLSYGYWQRRFGGRADVIGATLTLDSTPVTIVGVAARGFIGETSGQQPDLWLPLRLQPRVLPGIDRLHDTAPEKIMWLQVFGRLKPGVTLAQADAQANAIFQAGLESFYGAAATGERRRDLLDQRLRLQPGARGASPARSGLSQPLTALLAAVGLLLLIACANLANLLLARGAARRSEIALRASLGASRGRLIRQLATESLTLAAIGGAASIVVAYTLHGVLVAMLAKSEPDFQMHFALDASVMTFVVAATIAAGMVFGMLPAWQVTRVSGESGLREQTRGATGSNGQLRSGRVLVSLQLAMSLPLLVGAGLLARTVYNLQRADLGFPAERLLLVRVDVREAGDAARRDEVRRRLADEIRRVPGVRATSFSHLGVFSGGESSATIEVEGFTPKSDADLGSARDAVGAGYFSALGVPILLGRDILDSDSRDAAKVCIINEAFAKRFFEGRNPIGMQITWRDDQEQRTSYRIVGVAANAHTQNLRGDVAPRYFLPASQPPPFVNGPTFLIRTATDGASLAAAVREQITRVDASLRILSAASIEEQMAPLTAQDRTTAQLVVVFGGVALMLAAIGLYGVLSYGIARRAGEIAVRVALGARPRRVVAMLLGETVALVCAGLVVGGGLALAASRLIDSRLYGVAPQDPLTIATATVLLVAAALVAAYLPARRASKLDPMTALR